MSARKHFYMYEQELFGRTPELELNLSTRLELDPNEDYMIAVSGYIPVYMPNITDANNTVRMSKDAGVTWDTVTIPVGRYDIADIRDYLHSKQMETTGYVVAGGDTEDPYDDITGIVLDYDSPSNRTSIYLRTNFRFDVGTLGPLLGYEVDTVIDIERVKQFSPAAPNVDTFVFYQIWCNLVEPTMNQYTKQNTNRLFMDTVHVSNQPETIPYSGKLNWTLMKKMSEITNIKCRLIDEKGNLLDTRNEMMYLKLKIVPATMVSL